MKNFWRGKGKKCVKTSEAEIKIDMNLKCHFVLQKLKIFQNFICLIAVNYVYKSGVLINKEGKEKQSFIVFEASLQRVERKMGIHLRVSKIRQLMSKSGNKSVFIIFFLQNGTSDRRN